MSNVTSNDSKMVVEAKNLGVGYGQDLLWSGANICVGQGEFVAILGPNGAGKTTLFRALLGNIQILEGDLKVFGGAPSNARSQIGYVPQRRFIDSEIQIDVREFAMLALLGGNFGPVSRAKKARARQLVEESLRLVGAEEFIGKRIHELSGGQLQRVFMAQAMARSPSMLLLDEPLANLDMRAGANLAQAISDLVKSHNVTALLVAHDLNPLLPYLDRVIYIANHKVATGTPDEVFTSENLSRLYGMSVEVFRDDRGRIAIFSELEGGNHH
ncbi:MULTISPECIES: metal ABC transporter ATP-binding protein [Acidithrix]|uniref:Zinc import ATP-binding protein ZnuC n=1 Tax=Acidithrix ferrooxidans TaxID=1280514 RepID=A0A0D8HL36_9ACTN|nr:MULTISPECIES: metal ABC transporter ATP-binding protein [Acidithrix]KJF18643.1 zinc import ATP-binding protein ZnuC [Acidithrix ferrooxidans]CAG4930866.1 unnamed protein product [Acidithrix sp. C25]